jgi:hypothetical protein
MEERNYGITKRQMSLIGRSRKYDIEILSRSICEMEAYEMNINSITKLISTRIPNVEIDSVGLLQHHNC